MFKSLNGGKSWIRIGKNIHEDIYDIAVDPVSPSIVYVATWYGIYKSVNSGASWTKTSLNSSVKQIKVYPNAPQIVIAVGYNGVHYSNNRGNNWAKANDGLVVLEVNCFDWNLKKKIMYVGTDGGCVHINKELLKKIK